MAGVPIKNCYWVVPGKFLAGEYPRDKEDGTSQQKAAALVDAGVRAFIDLTRTDEGLLPYDQFLEPYAALGVSHQRFPIRDASVPHSPELTKAILDAIDEQLGQGRLVYVHCWGGVGRTGVIVGCWLARRNGGDGPAALAELQQLWQACPKSMTRPSPETREQEAYIKKWREPGPAG